MHKGVYIGEKAKQANIHLGEMNDKFNFTVYNLIPQNIQKLIFWFYSIF